MYGECLHIGKLCMNMFIKLYVQWYKNLNVLDHKLENTICSIKPAMIHFVAVPERPAAAQA